MKFCKYCGGRLKENEAQCSRCGADIDWYDGGQSFFDEDEIEEWSKKPASDAPVTIMPCTACGDEAARPAAPYGGVEENGRGRAVLHQKAEKKGIGYANLVIAAFIVMAIIIVAFSALLMGVIGEKTVVDTDAEVSTVVEATVENTTEVTEYKAESKSEEPKKADREETDQRDINEVGEPFEEGAVKNEKGEEINLGKGKLYKINGNLYIPFDNYMKAKSYKPNVMKGDTECSYKNDKDKCEVGVFIGTKNMYYIKYDQNNAGERRDYTLAYFIYNDYEKHITYVPAREFFDIFNFDINEDKEMENVYVLSSKSAGK